MKIAVIGIGGTGSAAARFLARQGHQVTAYEQFEPGHTRGSSHGESRIIRRTYPDEFHTRLMARAYGLWAELEAQAQEPLLVRCGGLLLGPPEHPDLQHTARALEAAGLEYRLLGPEEVRRRHPALRLTPEETALYQSESGFLRPTACVLANIRLAAAAGARIRSGTAVRDLRPAGDGVLVTTDADAEHYDRAIVTAGAWMGSLLRELGLPLRVEQRQVVYLRIARNTERFEPGRLPVWIDARSRFYGFPADGRIPGVKLASHVLGHPLDPDSPERPVSTEHLELAREYAARRLPDLGPEVTQATACLYTLTPDENFILDFAPGMPGVVLVSGCSGHGFKFTVLLGEIAAHLAAGREYPADLSPWSLRRFPGPGHGPGTQ